MTDTITVLKPLDQSYGLEEWAIENLEMLSKKTGLKLLKESITAVHEGFLVKNEILDQTFFVRCDNRVSSEYDLGCILTECSLQEPNGIIWLANKPHQELLDAFNWLDKVLGKDFEMYLIPVEVKFTEIEED